MIRKSGYRFSEKGHAPAKTTVMTIHDEAAAP
jgi:hypothetical protein